LQTILDAVQAKLDALLGGGGPGAEAQIGDGQAGGDAVSQGTQETASTAAATPTSDASATSANDASATATSDASATTTRQAGGAADSTTTTDSAPTGFATGA
jgi:hypothetical protein